MSKLSISWTTKRKRRRSAEQKKKPISRLLKLTNSKRIKFSLPPAVNQSKKGSKVSTRIGSINKDRKYQQGSKVSGTTLKQEVSSSTPRVHWIQPVSLVFDCPILIFLSSWLFLSSVPLVSLCSFLFSSLCSSCFRTFCSSLLSLVSFYLALCVSWFL